MTQRPLVLCVQLLLTAVGLSRGLDEIELQCVPLNECPKLQALFKDTATTLKNLNLIKTSQCSSDLMDPKVWCPLIAAKAKNNNCRTPEGEVGTCIPADQCPSYLKLLENFKSIERVTYLRKFICDDDVSVCCSQTIPSNTRLQTASERDRQEEECGRHSNLFTNKNDEGELSEIGEFPWTALLEYKISKRRTSTPCGGTLINQRYVVTAAHCVDQTSTRSIGQLTNVILGEFDTRNETDCMSQNCADEVVKYPVDAVIVHPRWYTKPKAQINHNIALVRLKSAVAFTNFIKPICLPPSTLTLTDAQKLVLTGWGQTENGVASFVKLKTTVSVFNLNQCIQIFRKQGKVIVGDDLACIDGSGGKERCVGDPGGPLMFMDDERGTWYLAGVIAFGYNQPCGVQRRPGLYTFLPNYVEWIRDTTK